MSAIDAITLEVPDPAAAEAFYAATFALGDRLDVRTGTAPTAGFRGYTLSLVVSQPSTVDHFCDVARSHGATSLKSAGKSMWGYGGVVQAPDGAIWKVATSSKKDRGPAAPEIDETVLLLGVADVGATKQFYVDRGFTVAKSYLNKYVQFEAAPAAGFTLGLYRRAALAKDAGVAAEGAGSHRIVVRGSAGSFTDPDGFAWEAPTQ